METFTPLNPTTTVAPAAVVEPKPAPAIKSAGLIVLIIDDVGFEGQQIDRVMALDPNVNFAVLPNGTKTDALARHLNDRGFEVLCHLPMEPIGGESPGRNAILTSMSDAEIEKRTRENIEAVPFARGVNNHMGSRATADERVMRNVMKALPKNMYFIDSKTGERSVVGKVARDMNIRTTSRNVFLDDVNTESAVRRQIAELASVAKKHGVAVGIGHPRPATVAALTAEVPALKRAGFRFIRASEAAQ